MEMAQKIPFFELFHTLELPWELRVALDGAFLTAVEVDRDQDQDGDYEEAYAPESEEQNPKG